MDEPPVQHRSISARIAALKLDQVGRNPGTAFISPGSQEKVDDAPRPPITRSPPDGRRQTTNNPVIQTYGSSSTTRIGNLSIGVEQNGALPPPPPSRKTSVQQALPASKPALPPRLPPRGSSTLTTPPLPPRRPSGTLVKKKDSSESLSSAISSLSSASAVSTGTALTSVSRSSSLDFTVQRVKAPAYDAASLPPLPAKKSVDNAGKSRPPLKSTQSLAVKSASLDTPKAIPSQRPRLPMRRVDSAISDNDRPQSYSVAARPSALSFALSKSTEKPPALPRRPSEIQPTPSDAGVSDTPPPVPLASRPTITHSTPSVVQRQQPRGGECMLCRDFSGPDTHAARFPREAIPSTSLEWLSNQLTSPFPSLTDKARAIFTWLHHNIEYDVEAFFNDALQPSTPSSTISSGLAVCEGYAGLFSALAIHAGLESVVISGHGKGYGFSPVGPNSPIPPFSTGHAWNAVKIDHGEWKLIDCCWGAGCVSGKGQPYTKRFDPSHFTMDNDEFGLRHFPNDRAHFYRIDGRIPTWEEYVIGDSAQGEQVRVYTGAREKHGLNESSFSPRYKNIRISQSPPSATTTTATTTIRFQFSQVCPHWNHETMGAGKPYPFILGVNGSDGAHEDKLPFDTDGQSWWCDVAPAQLGIPGQTVTVWAVTTIAGQDARGLSAEAFRATKGKKAMSWTGVAAWELV